MIIKKITVYSILENVGFHYISPRINRKVSARTKDAKENHPKVVEKVLKPPSPLPTKENEEKSDVLKGERRQII